MKTREGSLFPELTPSCEGFTNHLDIDGLFFLGLFFSFSFLSLPQDLAGHKFYSYNASPLFKCLTLLKCPLIFFEILVSKHKKQVFFLVSSEEQKADLVSV